LLMHNGRLSDPLDEFSKKIKEVSSKRKKTEEDHERMAELEFLGSLYLSSGKPCIPGFCIEAALAEAAKKVRSRKQAQAGIFVQDDSALVYDGPKTVDGLWKDSKFRLRASARVQNNRIMRTRPCFLEWSASFSVSYDEGMFNDSDIKSLVRTCGETVGLLDWRPRFGRFQIEA